MKSCVAKRGDLEQKRMHVKGSSFDVFWGRWSGMPRPVLLRSLARISLDLFQKCRFYVAIRTASWLHLIVSVYLSPVSSFLPHRPLQVTERYSERIPWIHAPSGISIEITLTSGYVIILLHFTGEGGNDMISYNMARRVDTRAHIHSALEKRNNTKKHDSLLSPQNNLRVYSLEQQLHSVWINSLDRGW